MRQSAGVPRSALSPKPVRSYYPSLYSLHLTSILMLLSHDQVLQ